METKDERSGPRVTVAQFRARYPELMGMPPCLRDELAARVLLLMARRGECRLLDPVTGRLTWNVRSVIQHAREMRFNFDEQSNDNDNDETDNQQRRPESRGD